MPVTPVREFPDGDTGELILNLFLTSSNRARTLLFRETSAVTEYPRKRRVQQSTVDKGANTLSVGRRPIWSCLRYGRVALMRGTSHANQWTACCLPILTEQ